MTHTESLRTKIMIINYTALCKRQPVLQQTTTVQPGHPSPIPRATHKKENHWDAVPGRFLLIQATQQKPVGDGRLWCRGRNRGVGRPRSCRGPDAPRSVLTPAKCPGVACRLDGLYWYFGKILLFLWALHLSHPVVPGFHARLRLPSRFRKLLGLTFISANWMECSWPFQWNQLTPWLWLLSPYLPIRLTR